MIAYELKQQAISAQFENTVDKIRDAVCAGAQQLVCINDCLYEETVELLLKEGFNVSFMKNMGLSGTYVISFATAEQGKKGTFSNNNKT